MQTGQKVRWRDHWLTLDPRSVGLFRMSIGCVLLFHFLGRWKLSDLLYGANSVLPPALVGSANEIPRFPTLLTWLEAVQGGMTLFFAAAFLAFGLLTIGLFSRTAAFFSLVAVSSLAHRNPYVLIGGDYVLASMLLWMLVLPIGDRFSVDSHRRRRSQPDIAEPASRTQVRSLAVLGVLTQLGLIYLASAWQKSGPTWWQDGTALAHVLGMKRYLLPGAELFSRLPDSTLALVTSSVLVFEYLVLPLILLPVARPWLRRLALAGLATLHLGIASVLNTGIFSCTMLACLPLLLSSDDWDFLLKLSGRSKSMAEPTALPLPALSTRWMRVRSTVAELASAWLFVGMLIANFNINFAVANRDKSLTPLDLPQRFAGAYQRWDMFTPDAPTCDPQASVRVRLLDGRLLNWPEDFEVMASDSAAMRRFDSFAWRMYVLHALLEFDSKRSDEIAALRLEYSKFLARHLAAAGRPTDDIFTIELWAHAPATRPIPGVPSPEVLPFQLSSHDLAAERRTRLAQR